MAYANSVRHIKIEGKTIDNAAKTRGSSDRQLTVTRCDLRALALYERLCAARPHANILEQFRPATKSPAFSYEARPLRWLSRARVLPRRAIKRTISRAVTLHVFASWGAAAAAVAWNAFTHAAKIQSVVHSAHVTPRDTARQINRHCYPPCSPSVLQSSGPSGATHEIYTPISRATCAPPPHRTATVARHAHHPPWHAYIR